LIKRICSLESIRLELIKRNSPQECTSYDWKQTQRTWRKSLCLWS